MKWHIALLGCFILTGTAYGQDYAPRSSSPTGIRPDAAAVSANFPLHGTPTAQASNTEATTTQSYAPKVKQQAPNTMQHQGGGNVAIQGQTSVNASARDMGSQAIGADNNSCASLGSIGECAR